MILIFIVKALSSKIVSFKNRDTKYTQISKFVLTTSDQLIIQIEIITHSSIW